MGQRNAGIGGAGERCGDAWHDLERHAGRGQCLGFLAAAAEHQRIAALQPDYALAFACQADQQRVDVRLLHAVIGARLADEDAFGITPCHVEHFVADKPVMHDHVGFAEQAMRSQRQQIGSAGTGADEMNNTRRFGVEGQFIGQRGFGGEFLPGEDQGRDTSGQDPLQHTAPRGKVLVAATDFAREAASKAGETAECGRHRGLDPLPQQSCQHWRHASGGDCDGDRITIDDGRHEEAAQIRTIDDVDRNAACLCSGGQRLLVSIRCVRADGQCAAIEVRRIECGAQSHCGTGATQRFGLAFRQVASTQYQGRAASQVHEQRKVAHQYTSRR